MSLLDQNWGGIGNNEDETSDDNYQGRQVAIFNTTFSFS